MEQLLTYSVSGNKLIVREGRKESFLLIYVWKEGRLILNKQFRIINLYLNMPVVGIILSDYPRQIQPGSEFTMRYTSTGLVPNANGTCHYMTFQSLSAKDESLTLSRVVSPRNELIQLYQQDYNYEIKYKIVNTGKCTVTVEFLIPNFSQEPESGAAYPVVDTTGKEVEPVYVEGSNRGRFSVNGYQFLLIIKASAEVKIDLVITALEKTTYPPIDELVLPVKLN